MKIYIVRCFFVFWTLFIFPCYVLEANEKPPAQREGWILVWEDEFEGKKIDTSKWRIEDAALVKNNEKQYYSPRDVKIKDGTLILRSRKKQKGTRPYMSGLVETKGKFTQRYGRFEIRAKLPAGQGIWPAHWLMNAVGTWPPEIDIMELIGHMPDTVHMTNHFGVYPNNRLEGTLFTGPDFTKDFHVFAMELEEKEIRWYVDGIKRFSTKQNVPKNIPFYLVLNTAVGGDWPGDPDNSTRFPQYHVIDYVRVYQRDIAGTRLLNTSAKNGKILVKPDKSRYKLDEKVKLKAVPDIGYKFQSWSGDVKSRRNPCCIKINDHKTITAHFVKNPRAPQLISAHKKASASSVEGEQVTLKAKNVTDGKTGTRWSSHFSDPQWIMIDLGHVCFIRAVRLQWEAAYGREYDIQVSLDAQKWKTVKSLKDMAGGPQNIWMKLVKARYIRLYGKKRATQWGYSLWEFEVFGKQ